MDLYRYQTHRIIPGAAKAEPGIQTHSWQRIMRDVVRSVLNHPRFWIPGSAVAAPE